MALALAPDQFLRNYTKEQFDAGPARDRRAAGWAEGAPRIAACDAMLRRAAKGLAGYFLRSEAAEFPELERLHAQGVLGSRDDQLLQDLAKACFLDARNKDFPRLSGRFASARPEKLGTAALFSLLNQANLFARRIDGAEDFKARVR
ncbi:MAG: hypothetical protein HQL41_17580, partial [Alphaproteobacteria bacterium]|nr:hypothetical protein [Alphaproteobacteria bacterium]